jgi:hypothetical protein
MGAWPWQNEYGSPRLPQRTRGETRREDFQHDLSSELREGLRASIVYRNSMGTVTGPNRRLGLSLYPIPWRVSQNL